MTSKQPSKHPHQLPPNPTIGVFDSGFGGLTVLRALLPLIPGARYIYLGDTARLPYGSKSRETITRYAVSSAKFLLDQGADLLVIACNTASALSLEDIQQALPIPVIGVIQPGAEAALAASNPISDSKMNGHPERSAAESKDLGQFDPPQNRVPHLRDGLIVAKVGEAPQDSPVISTKTVHSLTVSSVAEKPASQPIRPDSPQNSVLVLATTATTQSHAYAHALTALGLAATEKACPLLVPLVEEGWTNHHVTAEVLRIYLNEAFAEAPTAQTLLLGCTHYPLLQPLIERTLAELNHSMTIIDSAAATAARVAEHFPPNPTGAPPTCRFYATDSIEKFQRLGSSFLGHPLNEVLLLDLGG